MVKDLTGLKFNRLTVLQRNLSVKSRKSHWVTKCDCGNIKTIRGDSLQSGHIKSCGCLKKEQDRENLTANHSHKMSGTRLYHTWQGMKKRCFNPNNKRYNRYGGRGITICNEWLEFKKFMEWALANGYKDNLTIERNNNDGNYEPSNCRWATWKEQSNNRSTSFKNRCHTTIPR